MDVKAAIDGGVSIFGDLARMLPSFNGALAFGAVCLMAAYFLARSSIGKRARSGLEETLFGNWQLALLGSTGVILSLASGYTTWDGMKNFTGEAVLSGMVTFGIQGVMLIVAWLIGETFATGMSQVAPDGSKRNPVDGKIGMFLGLALVAVTFYALARSFGGMSAGFHIDDATRFSNLAMYFAFGLILIAIFFVNRRGDLALPYVQSTRVVVKSAVLWVMFLACMATSVFFSFDSLFSAIFPQAERKRAAEIRSVNQVAGVISDIGELTDKRRVEQAQALFTLPAWGAYEAELDKAARLASEAPDKIREQMTRELEAQKSRIAKLEEQKASAQSNQAGLVTRKQLLTDNVSRLESERPEAAQKVAEQKSVVGDAEKRLDEAKAKIMAEEKGVEGSGKVGKGQFYRAAKGEEEKIQSELQVARERLKGHETRLNTIVRGISTAKAELAQLDGSLANLKGEADTAAQMITVAQSGAKADINEKLDPSSMASALERDRQQFRQKPEQKSLEALQNHCLALQAVSLKVASLHDAAAGIDCDPKQASEAAARVFALNAGIENFAAACAGGDKFADKKTTDDLLAFGRKCLQDSGLPSKDTAEIAAKLSSIDLSRDDKAHRFVVTLNAFQDGNRLAYLALAIAIAIDSLVFMSGLFGANAVRSPLSSIPSVLPRNSSELEAIVEESLLPNVYENARAVRHVMHAIAPVNGFSAEVIVPPEGFSNSRVMNVLAAGAAIGAVVRDSSRNDRYLVRGELLQFLGLVTKRAFEADEENAHVSDRRADYENKLERAVKVALMPHIEVNAQAVHDAMHPIDEVDGFSAEVQLQSLEQNHAQVVRKVLNTGAAFRVVKRVNGDPLHFAIHRDLVNTLTHIQAHFMMSGAYGQRSVAGPTYGQVQHGGQLYSKVQHIAAAPGQAQIAAQSPQPRALTDDETRQQYLDNLLQAIGLRPEAINTLLGESAGLAIAAAEAFGHVRDQNALLQEYLQKNEDLAWESFSDTYDALRAGTRGDSQQLSLLDDAKQWLQNHWSVLMLLPGGRFERELGELLSKLETPSGDGKLYSVEQEFLTLVRMLRDQVSTSLRTTTEDWQRLGHLFRVDAGHSDVLVFKSPKAHGQR